MRRVVRDDDGRPVMLLGQAIGQPATFGHVTLQRLDRRERRREFRAGRGPDEFVVVDLPTGPEPVRLAVGIEPVVGPQGAAEETDAIDTGSASASRNVILVWRAASRITAAAFSRRDP
jgi:hypothetical protein